MPTERNNHQKDYSPKKPHEEAKKESKIYVLDTFSVIIHDHNSIHNFGTTMW